MGAAPAQPQEARLLAAASPTPAVVHRSRRVHRGREPPLQRMGFGHPGRDRARLGECTAPGGSVKRRPDGRGYPAERRSASATRNGAPFVWSPTAVQPAAEMQDTPSRKLAASPRGLGVGWIDHTDPWHASARVRVLLGLARSLPELAVRGTVSPGSGLACPDEDTEL